MMTATIQIEKPGNGQRAEPAEIWKARKLIQQHWNEKLGLTRVGKVVNVSANYLSEKFKQVTGENFVDYVTRTRIEKAQMLLQDRQRRVSDVAFLVGFQSLSQFNRAFKKMTGRSPTQFRRNGAKHFP